MSKTLWKNLAMCLSMALLIVCSCTKEEEDAPIDGTVTDENGPITLELTNLTATTAVFKGSVNLDLYSKYDEVGIIYSLSEDMEIEPLITNVVPITNIDKNNRFEKKMRSLLYGTKYYYSSYICMNGIYKFGEIQSFTTDDVEMQVSAPTVTSTTATFKGKVEIAEDDMESLSFGIAWSTGSDFEMNVNEDTAELEEDGTFTLTISDLKMDTEYHYATCIRQVGSQYGEIKKFVTTAVSMTASATKVTQTTVTFTGQAERNKADDSIEYGILYSTGTNLKVGASGCTRKTLTDAFDSKGKYSLKVTGLSNDTKYNYCWYARQGSNYKYGPVQQFTTSSVTINLSVTSITQTTATFTGDYEQPDGSGIEIGVLYSLSSSALKADSDAVEKIKLTNKTFRQKVSDLKYNTTYYYCTYVYQSGTYKYGSVQNFKTNDVTVEVSVGDITQTTATFCGKTEITESDAIEVGILYSTSDRLTATAFGVNMLTVTSLDNGTFSCKAEGLQHSTKYYYCYYACQDGSYTYGIASEFTTSSVTMNLSAESITQTTVTFTGNVELTEDGLIEVGVLYSMGDNLTVDASGATKKALTPDSSGKVSGKAECLLFHAPYNYCYYVCQDGKYTYGSSQTFTTSAVIMNLSAESITQTTATFNGNVELTEDGLIEVGVLYSTGNNLSVDASGVIRKVLTPDLSGNVSGKAEGLQFNTPYNYCYYICQNGKYVYGKNMSFVTLDIVAQDLSINGTANCYIISESGTYKIKAVKGNSNESVGDIASAEVLWESFGTDITPNVGDLITWASCSITGYIGFEVPSDFKEGNAVIAVKDVSGTILWSWHIWLTDQPQENIYNNDAGTMMDRNLGATSAIKGDVGALGLLYQWGRKDPFLGSSSISYKIDAKSTISWPSAVSTGSSTGTVNYVTSHPTTFVKTSADDWQYSSRDNSLWTTSDKTKSIYDPCPAGWRVPDGGDNGIWLKAGFADTTYDSTNRGISFSISSPSTTWYPASGYRSSSVGSLGNVGFGYYWSASLDGSYAYSLNFDSGGYVFPSQFGLRAYGHSVRCQQEPK